MLNMIAVYYLTKNPALGPWPKASWKERIDAAKDGVCGRFLIFILSLGGLFLGWFTPTESGAVGALSYCSNAFKKTVKLGWVKKHLAIPLKLLQ